RREIQDRGREAGGRPPETRRPGEKDKDGPQTEEARRETRRPWSLAKESERRGVRPVEQRRLLEVGDTVQPRRHEIAGGEHLPGDLRVARLVRLGEPRARGLDPDGHEEQKQGRE